MKITATSESKFNEIIRWTTPYGNYWAAVRLVGWISQNKTSSTTTLYFKWQVGADNYWPYWNKTLPFSVVFGGKTITDNFTLPQATNSWVDVSPKRSISVSHTNGSYSGNLVASGYKYFEAASETVAITFPDISAADTADHDAENPEDVYVPASVTEDLDTRFYIWCDGEVVYAPNDESHIVTNPSLSISINETDSLSFVIPPTNEMYSYITKLRSNIEVTQGNDILFRGRVIDDSTDFNNQKTVNCEGVKAYFNDTVMPPYELGEYKTAKAFFKAIVDQHNSQSKPSNGPNRNIVYVDCDITENIEVESDEYQQCSDALSSLAEAVSGYFKLHYYDDGTTGISFLSSLTNETNQVIEFGKNLLDVSVSVDATTIYNSVLPLGEKKKTYFVTSDTKKNPDKTYFERKEEQHQDYDTEGKPGYHKTRIAYSQYNEENFENGKTYYEQGQSYRLRIGNDSASNYGYIEDSSAIQKFGRIVRTFTFDDIVDTDPDTWESVDYVSQLREVGEVYLQAGLGADVTIEGRVVDYHMVDPAIAKLHVGDQVKIISTPHNLDGYYQLSSCTIQLQNPDQSDYTFGATIRALTDD